MLFTSIFDPAFTGLGVLLACALLATALIACGDPKVDDRHAELTVRPRRRRQKSAF